MVKFQPRDGLLDLADRVLDGTSTTDDAARLESLLAGDPAAQRAYLRYTLLHGQLPLTALALRTSEPVEVDACSLDQTTERTVSTAVHRESHTSRRRRFAAFVLVASVVAVLAMLTWQVVSRDADLANGTKNEVAGPSDLSHYDNRLLPIDTVATLGAADTPSHAISPTTLKIDHGETRFAASGGADVHVEGPAMFGVNSSSGGVLFGGSVRARVENPQATFSVQTANLRVVDLGTEFRVTTLDDQHVRVHVLDGEVEVQSQVRLPSYYWSFDETPDAMRRRNAVIGSGYTLGSAANQVNGLIGAGAIRFDNSNDSFVQIDGGAGAMVGNGDMAFSSGVTIEALILSRWSGAPGDYDEIFRKEDGVYRMLLSFQNDGDVGDYDLPEVTPGPCLSFGLHLEQHGYSELDMPLDGQAGRPSVAELTDGRPHHVVATYDSFSGRKAIYLDGRCCFEHTFPVGALILSGGPAPAEIGNTRRHEPFCGVIDEVALYDFALTPAEIAAHHDSAAAGKTYFGVSGAQLSASRWQAVTRILEGQQKVFDKFTGLPID